MPIAKTKDSLPLAEFLSARRKFLKIRLADLEQKTAISSRYLKKIESGDWAGLPSGVYARGFLKRYAQAVGLDEGEVISRYDEEFGSLKQKEYLSKNTNPVMMPFRATLKKVDIFSHFQFRKILIGAAVVFILGYIAWQFKPIFENPSLTLVNPQSENITVTGSIFEITGQASPGSVLTINNETVYAEENGSFKKDIELLPGLNVLEIKATSRFGESTSLIRRITYNKIEVPNK